MIAAFGVFQKVLVAAGAATGLRLATGNGGHADERSCNEDCVEELAHGNLPW